MPQREKNEWGNQMVTVHKAIRMLSRNEGASNEELVEELGVMDARGNHRRNAAEPETVPEEEKSCSVQK